MKYLINDGLQDKFDNYTLHILVCALLAIFSCVHSLIEVIVKLFSEETKEADKLIEMTAKESKIKDLNYLKVEPYMRTYTITTYDIFRKSKHTYLRYFIKNVSFFFI